MGCTSSKENALANVDDSVHVMIKHDKKKAQQKGEAPQGYVPRAPHPLLEQKKHEAEAAGDGAETKQGDDGNDNGDETKTAEPKE